jgi:hypothetical protein
MRSQKMLIASAAMLASTTFAGLSFADPPSPTTSTPQESAPTSADTTTTTTPPATSSSTSTTVTTGAVMTTPTSTTTTTGAEDATAMAMSPTPPAEARESITVYNKHYPNTPILVGGGLLLAGVYAATAGTVGAAGKIGDHDLYIPVVGPWINIAERSCTGDCPNESRDKGLIIASGIAQGVGALMVGASFLIPEKIPAARIHAGSMNMLVAPTAGGVGAVGTF